MKNKDLEREALPPFQSFNIHHCPSSRVQKYTCSNKNTKLFIKTKQKGQSFWWRKQKMELCDGDGSAKHTMRTKLLEQGGYPIRGDHPTRLSRNPNPALKGNSIRLRSYRLLALMIRTATSTSSLYSSHSISP